MARPLLPLDQLKNARVIRRSPVTGIQHDIPTPSRATITRWKWLSDIAINTVLSMPSRNDNIEKKLRITLTHSGNPPKDFPRGTLLRVLADGSVVKSYTAELLLLWLWQNKLTPDNPSMLYEKRRKHVANVTRLENDCENCLDSFYGEEHYVGVGSEFDE